MSALSPDTTPPQIAAASGFTRGRMLRRVALAALLAGNLATVALSLSPTMGAGGGKVATASVIGINPQPLPPGSILHSINPQPLPPGSVAINPQPLPPGE